MSVAFPTWLQNSKAEIVDSEEWANVTQDLYDAIQQQLAQSHVTYFTDLTDAEKSLFMDRAAKSIQHSDHYKQMMQKVSYTLDRHLSNEVARELLEEDPVETKPELVIEHVREGAVCLLKRWPEMKGKVYRCLNQRFPENLRYITWKLFLQNTLARKVYCDLLVEDPESVHSAHERDIVHKCEALLTAVPIFARAFPQAKASPVISTTMSKVLSYYHSKLRTANRLIDVQYLLLIPLLQASLEVQHIDKIASPGSVANLVEQYITLLEARPSFVRDAWGETTTGGTKLHEFCRSVGTELTRIDSSLTDYISSLYSREKVTDTTNANSANEVLTAGLKAMLKPMIRSMFVGFVECEVVLYMWDQWLMGLDTPEYDVWLPLATLTILLMKEPLMRATNAQQLEEVTQRQAILLTVDNYQYEFHKHFYKQLFAKLNEKYSHEAPVVDPISTLGLPAPWIHWTKEVLPERKRAEDRRLAREQRAAFKLRQLRNEREQQLANQRHELPPAGAQGPNNANNVDPNLAKNNLLKAENEKQALSEDRLYLEQRLEEERKKREDVERKAQTEISQLQAELQRLRRVNQPFDPNELKSSAPKMPTNDPMGEGGRAASVATLNGSQPEGNQTLIGKCIGGDEKAGDKHVCGAMTFLWSEHHQNIKSLPPFFSLN
ncbi:uncharacterized protein LOC142356058 isoform X2 [Convolutriloba macropyga]|uniref:uncharacterized protein LOC142356058 isoform X2 n=1 Tax=Convolutriloba macropyga TaxID=536237 RepID=UPI003F520339